MHAIEGALRKSKTGQPQTVRQTDHGCRRNSPGHDAGAYLGLLRCIVAWFAFGCGGLI